MNTDYPISAIKILLKEDCILTRFYPLLPYKNKLVEQLHKLGCQAKTDCMDLSDEALLAAGFPDCGMVQLFRAFLKLYDINPVKLKEIGSFCRDESEKQMYEELYHLPGVKKTRAMLYVQAGFRSLEAIAASSPQEIIARAESAIAERELPCKAPLMKEAKTHIAVARAFTGWALDMGDFPST